MLSIKMVPLKDYMYHILPSPESFTSLSSIYLVEILLPLVLKYEKSERVNYQIALFNRSLVLKTHASL